MLCPEPEPWLNPPWPPWFPPKPPWPPCPKLEPPPWFPPKDCPPLRGLRCTCAVAYFRDGTTSSDSTSKTVRFSPSRVSKLRWRRRPVTSTQSPLFSEVVTFSAACQQMLNVTYSSSPSAHP